jgi:non-ribosomal peptide synthetase component E (peptide arylation enzyme)
VIDRQGIIRITGRIKDIIIRGGENIAARDVEDVLSSHPGVEYAAVVGMSDPELGEKVCAFVKPTPGYSIDVETLLKHMAGLEAPKSHFPAHVEFVDSIPLTAAGKADKVTLKRQIETRLGSAAEKR